MPDIRVALSLYRHPWLVDAAILAVGQRILAGGKIDLEKKAAAYPVQLVQDAPENPEAPDTEKKVDGAVAVFPAQRDAPQRGYMVQLRYRDRRPGNTQRRT